jgi:hypothetical protein
VKDDVGVWVKTWFTMTVGIVGSWSVDELVQVVTLLYLVLQIGLLAPKYWRLLRKHMDKGGDDGVE